MNPDFLLDALTTILSRKYLHPCYQPDLRQSPRRIRVDLPDQSDHFHIHCVGTGKQTDKISDKSDHFFRFGRIVIEITQPNLKIIESVLLFLKTTLYEMEKKKLIIFEILAVRPLLEVDNY